MAQEIEAGYEPASISISKAESEQYKAAAEEIRLEKGVRRFSQAELLAKAIPFYMKYRHQIGEEK